MAKANVDLLTVIELIFEAVKLGEKIGYDKAALMLTKLRETKNINNDEQFIIKEVCDVYKVSFTCLQGKGNCKSEIKTPACSLISYLIEKYCSYPQSYIATEILLISKSSVNNYINNIRNLNPRLKADNEIIAVMRNIEDKLMNIKK